MDIHSMQSRLHEAGFADARFVDGNEADSSFGDSEAVFQVDNLLFKVVHDRGQEFLQIASRWGEPRFFESFDVELAFGWLSLHDVVSKQQPEALDDVLQRLKAHHQELADAFLPTHAEFTRHRVERAAERRAKAFTERLRSGQRDRWPS